MLQDLLLAHPLPENLHVLPTTRAARTGLALSSRNAYLTRSELEVAPVLYRALSAAHKLWEQGRTTGEDLVQACGAIVRDEQERLRTHGSEVIIRVDYFELFDRFTFQPVRGDVESETMKAEMVLVGAIWVGKTRLIDNILLGWKVD